MQEAAYQNAHAPAFAPDSGRPPHLALPLNLEETAKFLQCKTVAQSSALLKTDALGSQNHSAESCYENLNYDMIRVLMATMIGDTRSLQSSTDDALWDAVSIASYKDYMNYLVLPLSGVSNAGFTDSNGSAAQIYLSGANFPGTETGDSSESAASGGWYLSANDMLNVANAFRREGLLNPFGFDKPSPDPDAWFAPQNVLSEYYGIDWAFTIGYNVTCNDGTGYVYFGKQGSVPVPVAWPSGETAFYTSANSYLWFLPNDVEIALLVNSRIGPVTFLPTADGSTDLGNYDARTLLNNIVQNDYFPGTPLQWCSINQPGTSCTC